MSSQEIHQSSQYFGINIDEEFFGLFHHRSEDKCGAHLKRKERSTDDRSDSEEEDSNPLSGDNESNVNSFLQKHIDCPISLSENSFPQFPESNFNNSQFPLIGMYQDMENAFEAEQIQQESQINEKWIFQEIKTKVNKKNTTHYLVRLAVNNFLMRIESEPEISENLRQKLMQECEKIKLRMEKRDHENYILGDLSHFLTNETQFGREGCRSSRKLFQKILSEKYLQVGQNSQMKKEIRLNFMVNCKVYGLRCRHSKLVLRNSY